MLRLEHLKTKSLNFLEENKLFLPQMIPNLLVKSDGSVVQKTHIARTHDEDNRYELIALPETETKLSLLGNLFLCNGKKSWQH